MPTIIEQGMSKEEYDAFTDRLEELAALGNRLKNAKRQEQLFTMRCKACGTTFTYSYADIVRLTCGDYVKCPVCTKNIGLGDVPSKRIQVDEAALENEEYVKERSALLAIVHKYNIDTPRVLQ